MILRIILDIGLNEDDDLAEYQFARDAALELIDDHGLGVDRSVYIEDARWMP